MAVTISHSTARFYYDEELHARRQQLCRWLATHGAGAAHWADVLGWLNVVTAEMACRGITA